MSISYREVLEGGVEPALVLWISYEGWLVCCFWSAPGILLLPHLCHDDLRLFVPSELRSCEGLVPVYGPGTPYRVLLVGHVEQANHICASGIKFSLPKSDPEGERKGLSTA